MSFWRTATRSSAPLVASYCAHHLGKPTTSSRTQCDEQPGGVGPHDVLHRRPSDWTQGMRADEQGDYHGLFPKRQLWQPKLSYPLWDKNWDGLEPPTTGDKEKDKDHMRQIRKTGVTRHIILIRHGQYDEDHKEDEKRKLTELGKLQAELTGKRLREMIDADVSEAGPCCIKSIRVSNMTRAKETAEIIASHLPKVPFLEPDPMLNEGRPCHHIPGMKATPKIVEVTDENHPRIEKAFQRYFYREPMADSSHVGEDESTEPAAPIEHHQFEVIVCHANVIRYFVCRALQLPPEAWLRFCPFNCSLTYLTFRPTGSVSCRCLGDTGHLPYRTLSFSKHLGYNW